MNYVSIFNVFVHGLFKKNLSVDCHMLTYIDKYRRQDTGRVLAIRIWLTGVSLLCLTKALYIILCLDNGCGHQLSFLYPMLTSTII